MSYNVGDLVIGKVINVKPYAAFLEFDDGSQGLLHISEISDAYIRDIERFTSVGDLIKVKVLLIDGTNGFMRVSYKQVPEEEMFTTHTNGKRQVPNIKDDDFKVLEERLPVWIDKALKKAKGEKDD